MSGARGPGEAGGGWSWYLRTACDLLDAHLAARCPGGSMVQARRGVRFEPAAVFTCGGLPAVQAPDERVCADCQAAADPSAEDDDSEPYFIGGCGRRLRCRPVGDMTVQWGLSAVDGQHHAIDVVADHPLGGVLVAECGHQVKVVAPLHDEPPGAVCQTCADRQYDDAAARLVAGRPISSHRGCPQCSPASASNVLFERLAATVEQREIQLLIGQVLALAEQEAGLTDEQLRDRLTALAACRGRIRPGEPER